MDKIQAKNLITDYFKANNIEYCLCENVSKVIDITNIGGIHLMIPAPQAINGNIEVMLRFRESHLQIMSYYAKPILSELTKTDEMCDLLNYINATVDFEIPFSGTLAAIDDDIAYITHIGYPTISVDFQEVVDYILEFQKNFLEPLCIPFIFLGIEKFSLKDAKSYINEKAFSWNL